MFLAQSAQVNGYDQGYATLIAAVIAALVGVLSLIRNNKSEENGRYLNLVSANRVAWLQLLKSLIAEYCALVESFYCSPINKPSTEDFFRLRMKIKMQLNFNGNPDDVLYTLIRVTSGLVVDDDTNHSTTNGQNAVYHLHLLTIVSQIYCKTEWERIKFEAKNHLFRKFDFDKKFLQYAEVDKIKEQIIKLENITKFDLYKALTPEKE